MHAPDPRTPRMDAAEELGHVRRARKGDRRAFEALLRRYHRPAYRLAFALTRDVRAAVAVTHASMVMAMDGIRYLADGQRFFPWAAGIVRNLARARAPAGAARAAAPGGPRAAPGVVAIADRLLAVMADLGPDEQAAVALRIVEQLPHSEIEAVLRLAPGSARSLLATARSRLSAQIAADEPGDSTHLTLDQLSAHLDGAPAGVTSDPVRRHLKWCELCRLRGVRMASASEALAAFVTHDPEERFFEALEGFLVRQVAAADRTDGVPAELEELIAAEIARLDARRWAAVSEAIPRALAGAAGEAHGPAAAVPVPGEGPGEPVSPRAPTVSRQPIPPARSATPGEGAKLRSPGGPIGAAVVALALLLAGLYLTTRSSRPPRDDSPASTGGGSTRGGARLSVPAIADSPAGRHQAPAADAGMGATTNGPGRGTEDSGATGDPGASATPALGVPETQAASRTAPESAAAIPGAGPPAVSGARRRTASASPAAAHSPPSSAAPARVAPARGAPVAAEPGLFCGQVRDESGMPVVRAQVLLADVQIGAMTDRHGRFCISVPIGTRTLSVIALGFATQRRVVTVARRTPELAITLRSTVAPDSPAAAGR